MCGQIVSPGVAYIAEAIVAPEEIVKYFGEGNAEGDECDIAYNATFMALIGKFGNTDFIKKIYVFCPEKAYEYYLD